ncbi:MAG TPA: hypothetical protein VF587_10600 [Solirubrobacteraceae bacterium]
MAPNGDMAGDSGTLAISDEGLHWTGRRSFPIPWTHFWSWGLQEKGVFRPQIEIWVIVRGNTSFRFNCGRTGEGGEAFFESIKTVCPMDPM